MTVLGGEIDAESPLRSVTERSAEHRAARANRTRNGSRRPRWNNLITMTGLTLTALSTFLLVSFWMIHVFIPSRNPYVDIAGFLILPGILIASIAIIPLGIVVDIWRLRRRRSAKGAILLLPSVNLRDPRQRRAIAFVFGGTFVLLPFVGVSSYQSYHFSDSNGFCANACHDVMEPQATTYAHSPHARVACVECHIGSGATSFVKAKLSGTREVWATWRDNFERPLPPAISRLRPARETCEQCHWPETFHGNQLKEVVHFAQDEANSRRTVRLMLNTGGGDGRMGRAAGIHWHMLQAGEAEFVASDDHLQEIPWVRWTDREGNVMIYRSDGRPASDPRPEGPIRRLDCMDCHNRASHKMDPPDAAVDERLVAGEIDSALPYIKREAVRALVRSYESVEQAEAQIGESLAEYYTSQHPEVWEADQAKIYQAIDTVRELYRDNFFPGMNTDWTTYPDNVGHLVSPGCFRCHDGKHVNQFGQAIRMDCDACHSFLNPLIHENGEVGLHEGPFVHPMELDATHATLRCDQCHNGGLLPPPACDDCHREVAEFFAGKTPAFGGFGIEPDPMDGLVECDECHDASQPHRLAAVNDACLECHDEEEGFAGVLESWKDEVDGMLRRAETEANDAQKMVLRTLRAAGPLHNYEAARTILRSVLERHEARAEADNVVEDEAADTVAMKRPPGRQNM